MITKREILGLLTESLEGSVTLESLLQRWPRPLDDGGLLAQVWSDIEDAVEHYPAAPFSRRPLTEEWKKSGEYLAVYLDFALLSSERPLKGLANARLAAKSMRFTTSDDVDRFINEWSDQAAT